MRVRIPLNGCSESGAGDNQIVCVNPNVANLAAGAHCLDAKRVILQRDVGNTFMGFPTKRVTGSVRATESTLRPSDPCSFPAAQSWRGSAMPKEHVEWISLAPRRGTDRARSL